jgi:DNA replication protein
MKNYPDNSQSIYVPSWFFQDIIHNIRDGDELKILLLIFQIIRQKKVYPGYILFDEIDNDILVQRTMDRYDEDKRAKIIHAALEHAVECGMLLTIKYKADDKELNVYVLNTVGGSNALNKIVEGKMVLKGIDGVVDRGPAKENIKNIYTLYEQNIGMLTPIIAEQLKIAEKTYPEEWIRDAFSEAVDLNKRNWRYVQRILESWATEGKSDGTYRRNTKKDKDPDRFIKGKYGHMVQR